MCNFAFKFVSDKDQAEDIVQDVFVKFWDKYDSFSEIEHIKSYLFKATKNKAIEYIRSNNRRSDLHEDVSVINDILNPKEVEKIDELIRIEKIKNAIELLPAKCKEIFKLSKLNGYTYQEIADIRSISKKTVENQMLIAVKKIKEILTSNRDK